MKIIKNIFSHLFALYAILLFVITLIPVYVVLRILKTIVSKTRFEIIFHATMQIWMGVYLPLIFCPVKIKGKEKFAPNQNYVVILNHNSLIDIPVSTPSIPSPNKTLGKSDFLKVPLFGFIYACGSVIINRSNNRSKQHGYEQMLEVLKNNMHVCLYPEGTRNKSITNLQSFKDGAFKLAIESQKPIMVGVIEGTKNIITSNKFFHAWPSSIIITYVDIIPTTDYTFSNIKLLKEKAYEIMNQQIDRNLMLEKL
jgi:1-acyl-sn-glycerol-3-phosphate acyltransferase